MAPARAHLVPLTLAILPVWSSARIIPHIGSGRSKLKPLAHFHEDP
jgi:hypothetical protein